MSAVAALCICAFLALVTMTVITQVIAIAHKLPPAAATEGLLELLPLIADSTLAAQRHRNSAPHGGVFSALVRRSESTNVEWGSQVCTKGRGGQGERMAVAAKRMQNDVQLRAAQIRELWRMTHPRDVTASPSTSNATRSVAKPPNQVSVTELEASLEQAGVLLDRAVDSLDDLGWTGPPALQTAAGRQQQEQDWALIGVKKQQQRERRASGWTFAGICLVLGCMFRGVVVPNR